VLSCEYVCSISAAMNRYTTRLEFIIQHPAEADELDVWGPVGGR